MKSFFKFLILFSLILISTSSFAFTAPPLPPNGTYVLDLAGKLSNEQVNSLNEKIQTIKSSTDNEYAILILQNMDGNNIEDVAYTTFNSWGVGKKYLDNGVLIVIAVSERKTRIETGKGVGELTDLQSNDILANTLRPFLKKGDYFGGLNATIDAINKPIESRKNAKTLATTPNSSSNNSVYISDNQLIWLYSILGFGVITTVFFIFLNIKREKQKQEKSDREFYEQLEQARKESERSRKAAIERIKNIPETKSNVTVAYKMPTSIPEKIVKKESFPTKTAVVGTAVIGAAVAAEEIGRFQREEAEKARKRREREEEEERDRKRRSEESSSSSSYSSWSSSDNGSSWGGSDSGSFGGFDGGSSGGGGSSSDF